MAEPDAAFETLLVHLRDTRGCDFTGYERHGQVFTFREDLRPAVVFGRGDR